MAKANQQQTLYRFRTLRDPELTNPEDQNLRFVFNNNITDSYFYDAVINRPTGTSKWKAMMDATSGFTPINSVLENDDHVAAGEWLARNRGNATAGEIYNKLSPLSPINDPAFLTVLWDNLYYQVLKHDYFYVKEMCAQVLILQNLLEQIDGLTKDDAEKIISTLAKARVVLSEVMFVDSGANPQITQRAAGTESSVNFSTKQLAKNALITTNQLDIERNEKAIGELTKLQSAYLVQYQNDLNSYNKDFERDVEEAYANATPVEKEDIDCSGCKHYWVDYINLNLPKYDFLPKVEIEPSFLKTELTPESLYVVELLGLLESTRTYQEIIDGINANVKKLYNEIYRLTPNSPTVVTIGNMTFKNTSTVNVEPGNFPQQSDIPFIAYFYQITSGSVIRGRIVIVADMGYPNADATAAEITATVGGSVVAATISDTTDTPSGNSLTIVIFTSPDGVTVPTGVTQIGLIAEVTMSSGMQFEIKCDIPLTGRIASIATVVHSATSGGSDSTAAFVPSKFGIRRLGIADYKKVVSEVCCYREAEVSHIENIMQGEFKSKTTTRERTEETTVTTERSTEIENLTDTTTSERFEMQTEIAKLHQEQKEANAYVVARYESKPYMLEVGGGYATASSKEEANRQAVTEAKETTQRAMERVVTKFREEIVRKVTESYKDENSHIFDNRTGDGHVSGIYRFINAIYKNQIYNYGKRLMYEFMIPQPSKIYRYGITVASSLSSTVNASAITITPPESPESVGLLSAQSLNVNNYQQIAAKYKAEIEAMPSEYLTGGTAYHGEGGNGGKSYNFNDLKVPAGYKSWIAYYKCSIRRSEHNNVNATLHIGNRTFSIIRSGNVNNGYVTLSEASFDTQDLSYSQETVPVSMTTWDVGAFSINLTVKFKRTDESYQAWQNKTYDAIIRAYQDRLREYEDSLQQNMETGDTTIGTNPLFYRQIEMTALKKNCITYLLPSDQMGAIFSTGDTFDTYSITQSQEMDNYASKAKFMEQAFDWEIMSYNFYPYYWGPKDQWLTLYQSENDDPLFRAFMQSGIGRVVVSVKPGFEEAVMHYMETGEIWNGGEMPVIGDPLYLSIVDELAEQEYTIEETWETVVPTSLVGIQKSGVVIDVEGLPCGDGCEIDEGGDALKPNDNKLDPVITQGATN